MEETPTSGLGKEKEPKRRRLVHPHGLTKAPLTHQLDLEALRETLLKEYQQAGLIRPELECRSAPRSDKRPVVQQSSVETSKENRSMPDNNAEQSASPKPGVAGTQQVHRVQVQEEIGYAQKCLWAGGTTIVSGATLMLAWKGLGKWLG